MCVTLTPAAATFMKRFIRMAQMQGAGNEAGFRLTVKAGGCSGFDSSFTVEPKAEATDSVLEQHGVRLFLPVDTCELLRGYTVDFAESRTGGGLSFSNPAAPNLCACSSSGEAKSLPPGVATVSFMKPPAPGAAASGAATCVTKGH